jgi:hypothetical protein
VFSEERERWKTLIAQQGVVRNFEFQIRRYDGAILWLNNSARAVKDEQGRVIYYEGSLEDITERKRMEAEREHLLQAAREHLRRADALRQACAALTSTLNYEEVLKRILEQVSQVVPHDTANIMLIKGEHAQVIQGHGYEDFDPQLIITTITLDMSKTPILQRMQATGQPEAIPSVEQDTGSNPTQALRSSFETRYSVFST